MALDPERSIENLRERIEARENISDEDAEALLAMSDELFLRQSNYSAQRHRFHLVHNRRIAEGVGGLADALEDKSAAEDIVRWINRTYDNPETNKDYRTAFRIFGELVSEGDGKPDSISWVPSGYPDNYDPMPEPAEMLTWDEDLKPMLESCHNHRDRAVIALAWDLGPRPFELRDLQYQSISDHKYGKRVTVDGKRGKRSPVIIPSVPYVQKWLDIHPCRTEESGPLWSRLNSPEKISYRMLLKILKQAAARAGVSKPVTPSNFRKSSASYLASEGVPQAHLEEHHGWKRGSKVAARYITVFGDAADREIARIHGLDVGEDEGQRLGPQECHRCEQSTPRDEAFCVWCGAAMSPVAAKEAEEAETELVESIAEADGELASSLLELREVLSSSPELRSAILGDVD